MKIGKKPIKCKNGHFYDPSKFDECPVCKANSETDRKGMIEDIGETVPLSYEEDDSLTVAIEATGFDAVPVFDESLLEENSLTNSNKMEDIKPAKDMFSGVPPVYKHFRTLVRCVNGHYFDRTRFERCPVCGEMEEGAIIQHPANENKEVAGWLVCVSGRYKGRAFVCEEGRNRIGNDMSYEIALTMEPSVTREVHAYLIYEPKNSVFYLENGIGNGLVYLNDEILFSHNKLEAYDKIQIGKVTFVFVPLCGDKFKWEDYAD